jgi:hypothetical protein
MALRYFRSTGTNWGTIGDWSSTPSPSYTAVAAIPTAADDVIFEAASANCTLNVAGTCLSFNASTYGAKTWALGTNNISVAGGVFTLGTGMTVTGTGTLIRTGAGNTLTSNGVIWTGSIQFNINTVHTWGDGWTISGSLTSLSLLTINGTFNFTIGGSLISPLLTSTSTYTLNGTGNLNGAFVNTTIIINTALTITLPTAFTIGSGSTLRLTAGTVNVTSGHNLTTQGGTLDTDRTSTGGNKISFYNFTTGNSNTTTLQSNLTITNNFSNPNNLTTVGAFTIFIGGSLLTTGNISGTATLEMNGSLSATVSAGAILINLIINKTGVAVVTFGSTLTWGAANKTLTINSPVDFTTNSNTLTLSGSNLIINNPISGSFFNLTIPSGLNLTFSGASTSISRTLLCSGSATFAGTHGFITQNFTCTLAASIITLQNINANPLAEYIVNGVLTLIGTLANRITLQAAGSATFNGTITPVGQLNYLSGTIPSIGMTLSQNTGVSPVGLIGLLPNRPVITGGTSPTFTITPSATAIIGTSFSMRAGYKAKFTLTNGTGSQNVAYTTTQDIDSNSGATITSFGSNGDDINNTTISLFRTLNWGPLIAPSGSVYYTFVN